MYDDVQVLPQQMQHLIGSVERGLLAQHSMQDSLESWRPVNLAPFGCDLQLCVIDKGEVHALVFACRRVEGGWMHALTGHRVSVDPTHWRHWDELAQSRPVAR
jgi:hypothetical protein